MQKVLTDRVGVATRLLPSEGVSDQTSLEPVKEAISACLAQREMLLIIDLTNVPTLNSQALELLLDSQDELARRGGGLTLTNVNTINQDVLRITGVNDYVDVLNSSSNDLVFACGASTDLQNLRLGDLLIEAGLASEDRVEEAIRLQSETGKRMGEIMVEREWVSETEMLKILSQQLDVPYTYLRAGVYDLTATKLVDHALASRLKVLPLFNIRGVLTLATSDPQSIPSFDEIERHTGLTVQPVLAKSQEIEHCINEAFEGSIEIDAYVGDLEEDFELIDQELAGDFASIDEIANGSPVINLVNAVIQRAIRDGASDIHIEPSRNKTRIRLRVDGILYEVMTAGQEMHPALVSRLKVMANLDISERRLPQDGRIQVSTRGNVVDLRFSSLPGVHGEKIVLRVLDKSRSILAIDKLGMSDHNQNIFTNLLTRSHGLMLVTGPTGSGKTTTLYSAIEHLNNTEKSIVTIEDPVEYQLDIINQNQVKDNVGLSFAKLLKHVLRQDPDIIMVGEIRDHETAEIAIQAALTGHMVLSTLHTTDAIGAVTRLLDMGVEPYLLSSALVGSIAQRLVRTVCPDCKTTYVAPPELMKEFGWPEGEHVHLSRGRGCTTCYDSGYKGRMAVHEIVQTDSALQNLMMTNPSRDDLSEYIEQAGVVTLYDDGLERVHAGETTIEEVKRIISAD